MENGGSYYDMTHPDGWHYVRPVDGVCVTTMLIGPKWNREEIKSDEPLKPLPNDRKLLMLEYFRLYYLGRNGSQKAELLKELKHGDWVTLEDKLMNSQELTQIGKYVGKMAFVIKTEGVFAHIRFKEGNDRIISHLKNLTLLDPKDKLVVEKKEDKPLIDKEKPIGMILEDSDFNEIDEEEDLDEKNI